MPRGTAAKSQVIHFSQDDLAFIVEITLQMRKEERAKYSRQQAIMRALKKWHDDHPNGTVETAGPFDRRER
jgi:hypothetical protein